MGNPDPGVARADVAAPFPRSLPVLEPNYFREPRTDDYAVIVGIEKYPDLPAATYAERDAAAAKNFIRARVRL